MSGRNNKLSEVRPWLLCRWQVCHQADSSSLATSECLVTPRYTPRTYVQRSSLEQRHSTDWKAALYIALHCTISRLPDRTCPGSRLANFTIFHRSRSCLLASTITLSLILSYPLLPYPLNIMNALTLNSPVSFRNQTASSTRLYCSPAYPNFSIIFHTHHASQPLTLLLQPPLFISSLVRLTPCGRGVCNRPRGAHRPPELRRRFESPSPVPPSRGPSPPESR